MLQQTRVSTVVPYFEKWMARFPDFENLAAAKEDEVLGLWQGLGYYSRARNLHKLARRIAEDGIPDEVEGWLALPGIGPYSASAIASIAQGCVTAVVDGNVVRVLARLTASGQTWKSSGDAVKGFAAVADEFLDRENPGSHNEAVMELGALVCLPRSPLCTVCPLVSHCRAASLGVAGELPRIVKPGKVEKFVQRAWVVADGKILLQEIPSTARRLAGMWELPLLADISHRFQAVDKPFATRRRGIGNEVITELIFRIPVDAGEPVGSGLQWVPLDSLDEVALSGPHRRWIGELR